MRPEPRVVLVGAGHAHLVCLRQFGKRRRPLARITLLDPANFVYSGTASGVLEGRYPLAVGSIDPAGLCRAAGAAFIRDAAVGLDPEERRVFTAAGESAPYDILSVNTGSRWKAVFPSDDSVPLFAIKPISRLAGLREYLLSPEKVGAGLRIAVAGGGPSGCEIAAALAVLRDAGDRSWKITLVHPGEVLSGAFPDRARTLQRRRLESLGVEILSAKVRAIADSRLQLEDANALPIDIAVGATGLKPRTDIHGFEPVLGPDGGISVGPTLQTRLWPRVFACGDCAHFEARPLPKIGVYGVRQGAHLARAIPALGRGEEPPPFEPQEKALLILNQGRGKGLATRGNWAFDGRLAGIWKDLLDRRFLKQMRGR